MLSSKSIAQVLLSVALVAVVSLPGCAAFVPPASTLASSAAAAPAAATSMNLLPVADVTTIGSSVDALQSASLLLSETEPWVQPLANVLGPFLNIFSFAMLCRVVISWYPTSNLNEFPFALAVWPTEPLLRLIRGAVPPAFGVDITPIVWLGVFTFFNEILLGQQGLLTMKIKYGI
mmetsp:Transcript_17618/g.50446  ORF Transcript_17618/g.50446 Transcript_17618/m.50446 type:complete len:176 (-) Transcript_17618:1843-2370(-)